MLALWGRGFQCGTSSWLPADLLLQEELVKIFPMVGECNAMSEELDKKCKFDIVLVSPQACGKKEGQTQVLYIGQLIVDLCCSTGKQPARILL